MAKKPSYRNQSGLDETRNALKKLEPAARQAFFARKARADNTQRTYASAQRLYLAWCEANGYAALPGSPEQVAGYLDYLAMEREHKPTTLRTYFAGIARYYRDAQGKDNCTQTDYVQNVLSGIQRTLAQREVQAKALTVDLISALIEASWAGGKPKGLQALRDRALILVGYACAFRRSETASLRRDEVTFESRGVLLLLRSSKTDQLGAGRFVGMCHGEGRLCPVRALRAWLKAIPECEWVFPPITKAGKVEQRGMTDKSVNLVVKRMVEAAGMDSDGYSAHSLRAGMTTDLVASGMSTAQVKQRTRHTSDGMVSRYVRNATELDIDFTRAAMASRPVAMPQGGRGVGVAGPSGGGG